MAVRTGSLSRELGLLEAEILDLILEDYKLSARRERSSRVDFGMGWLAAMRRKGKALLEQREAEPVPW
jgi:hypothetical protein